jgi:hypothetical protein
MDEILFEARMVAGKMFRVYSNRFEYEMPGLFAGKKVLPIRSISNIERPTKLNKIVIKMNDGKKYEVVFWNSAKVLEELVKFL